MEWHDWNSVILQFHTAYHGRVCPMYHVIICSHMLFGFPSKKETSGSILSYIKVYALISGQSLAVFTLSNWCTHPGRGHGLPYRVDDSIVTGASSFTDAAGWDDRVGDTMFDACVYTYMPRRVMQICLVYNSSVSNAMLWYTLPTMNIQR